MSDYTRTKQNNSLAYPVHANGTSNLLSRVEPLLTPSKLKSRFLKGIFENLPKEFQFSNDELKDRINLAINDLEIELKTPIFAEQFKIKVPFDQSLYRSFIKITSEVKPVLSIEQLAIMSADEANLFEIPPNWIETANFHTGQINVIPLLSSLNINMVSGSITNAGVIFLQVLGGLDFLPAFWQILVTAGICKDAGTVPIVVNNLIGVQVALDVLSSIGLANPNNSVALSQDGGISQSTSGPGAQLYQTRIGELKERKAQLIGQLKRITSNKVYLTNI